jgi:hypothetical protein
LDSIRAVKASGNITGIGSDPTVTLYGYSGGAASAGWVSYHARIGVLSRSSANYFFKATELQPDYAPDVQIHGAAIGGLIPNETYLAGN